MARVGWLWNLFYLGRAPWDIGGPRPELVRLVESGRLQPCRAIDLGCGIGENVIYLAQQGFDITGVDIASRAIAKARRKARTAGVSPTLLSGDVTNLKGVKGPFGLVVDNGCLHSLVSSGARESYVRMLLKLTRAGSFYWLRCFVKCGRFSLGSVLEPGEVERRFGGEFDIEDHGSLAGESPTGQSTTEIYFMRRKSERPSSATITSTPASGK